MKLDRVIRVVLGVVILLGFVAVTGALLFVTESALNVWDRLSEGPRFLLWGYAALLAAIVIAAVWLIWRDILPGSCPSPCRRRRRRLSAGI